MTRILHWLILLKSNVLKACWRHDPCGEELSASKLQVMWRKGAKRSTEVPVHFSIWGHIFLQLFDFSRRETSSPLLGLELACYGTGQATSIEVPTLVLSLFSVTHTPFPHHSSSVSPENRPPPAIGVGRGQGPVGALITRIQRRPGGLTALVLMALKWFPGCWPLTLPSYSNWYLPFLSQFCRQITSFLYCQHFRLRHLWLHEFNYRSSICFGALLC